MYDLVVIGGGMGGLAAGALARRLGLRTALLEAHTKLGGCAGYFSRGPYTFDAGATALMGLGPDEPVGSFLKAVGVEFAGEPTGAYRVCLPDRTLDITPDAETFERSIAATFPGRTREKRDFWRLQALVGSTLFDAAGGLPRLPWRTARDILHDLRLLGPGGVLAGATWAVTVRDVLRFFGIADDLAHTAFVAMLVQDTAQAGPETVPFANAAACLQAYRRGMCRPRGGMRALAEGLGGRFAAMGGDLRTATLVDRVERVELDGGRAFAVVTRRRDRLVARQVAFNLPFDRAASLLGRTLDGRLGRIERKTRAAWSAVTGYLAVDRRAVPDDAPLFHQVLTDDRRPIHDGNNVLVSLSPVADPGYGPPDVRVATLSTHVRPDAWQGLDRSAHAAKKAVLADRLLAALGHALPEAPNRLVHAEFGTPKSFARYTRRAGGAVGGAPVARGNSVFLSAGADALGPGLWVVGDSVFPGQGTMATVLSAVRVIERITGRPRAGILEGR